MKPAGFVLAAVGAVLIIAGLILGFGGVTRAGVSCGSAFSPNTNTATIQDLTEIQLGETNPGIADACQAATSDRKPLALAVLIPGVGLLVVGAAVAVAGGRRVPVAA